MAAAAVVATVVVAVAVAVTSNAGWRLHGVL